MLRDSLQPTDFLDADWRVTDWHSFDDGTRYRIHVCSTGNHWFQRHEWLKPGRNASDLDTWIYTGYFPRKKHDAHYQKRLTPGNT